MFLLYVDESGHSKDPNQKYFVLAGVSVFERQSWWLSNELDDIAKRFNKACPEEIELHGSPMLQGRGGWKSCKREDREQAMKDALGLISQSPKSRVFAVVVDKAQAISNSKDIVHYAFEQLLNRFDLFLGRMHREGNTQRGMILFDKSAHEFTLQRLAHDFRTVGHTWGSIRNLSEVPVFIDSKASRLIQLADLVSYAVFRNWEKDDSRFYNVITHDFDKEGSVTHGLYVYS